MRKIVKKEPQTHAVIVDTNILWHEDKKNVVNPEFESFWKEQCSSFNLDLFVPEVVKGELLFQQATSAIKARKTIDECMDKVNSITEKRYRHQIRDDEIKSRVELRFDKWLKSFNGKILVTPYRRIKWKDVIHASIWREPPFEFNEKDKDKEKGFRDAVILETIADFCTKNNRDISIAFICDDELLRETSDKRLSKETRFTTYESLEEFGSYLKLTQEELTNQFIRSILRKASEKFFKRGDPSCLFRQYNLDTDLKEKFKTYFDDPILSEPTQIGTAGIVGDMLVKPSAWSSATYGRFWIGRAQFKELEGRNIYHWLNIVTHARLFERDPFDISDSDIWIAPEDMKKEEKILLLPFHIVWKSKVLRDARFFDLEIEDVKLKGNEFRWPTEEDLKIYGLEKAEER
jgi:hypothetical protein